MAEVNVLAVAKLLRNGTTVREKKYAITFDAAEDATVAALVQRLRSKEAFAGLSLELDGVTVLDTRFNDYVEVESGDRLATLTDNRLFVTFIEARNKRVEQTVAYPSPVVQKAVEEHQALNNDHPPEFAELSLSRSATAPPTCITSIAKESSTSGTDSDKVAAFTIALRPNSQSSDNAGNVVEAVPDVAQAAAALIDQTETNTILQRASSRCSKPVPCKQEDDSASEGHAIGVSGVPPPAYARTVGLPSGDATAPWSLTRNTDGRLSNVAALAQQTQFASDATGTLVASITEEASPSGGVAVDVERQVAVRETSITCPMDVKADHTEEEEENPDNQIVEGAPTGTAYDDEMGQVAMPMEWDEVEPIVTPEDDPMEAIPLNAILTKRGADHSATAEPVSQQNPVELAPKSRSPKAVKSKKACKGRMDFDDDAEPDASAPREGVDNRGDDESPGRRMTGKCNPVQDFRSRASTGFAGQTTNQDRRYKCDTCGNVYDTRQQLVAHGSRCDAPALKTTKLKTVKWHKCGVCGKAFERLCNLVRHRRIHTGEKPFECDECPKRFNRPDELKNHKRKHTGEYLVCDECGKSFVKNSSLTDHKRQHTGEMPYECEKCQKRFNNRGSLSLHRRQHSEAKAHVCKVCKKAFASAVHLVKHMRARTGEKPYECDECGRRFTTSAGLKIHKRMHGGAQKGYRRE